MTTRVVVEPVHAYKVVTQDLVDGVFVSVDEKSYAKGESDPHLYITSTRRVIIEEVKE